MFEQLAGCVVSPLGLLHPSSPNQLSPLDMSHIRGCIHEGLLIVGFTRSVTVLWWCASWLGAKDHLHIAFTTYINTHHVLLSRLLPSWCLGSEVTIVCGLLASVPASSSQGPGFNPPRDFSARRNSTEMMLHMFASDYLCYCCFLKMCWLCVFTHLSQGKLLNNIPCLD